MKHALVTTVAAISFFCAGSALADSQITAKLAAPPSPQTKLIAASAVWNCAGDTCTAAIAPDDATGVSGCKDLAKQVGRLSAYVPDGRSLDDRALAKCNTAAKAPQASGAVSAAR